MINALRGIALVLLVMSAAMGAVLIVEYACYTLPTWPTTPLAH